MRDLKYLAAYINPVLAAIGLWYGGVLAWSAVIFSFVMIPLLDQISPVNTDNVSQEQREQLLNRRIFDWLLYLNLPIVFGVVALFLFQLQAIEMTLQAMIGNILSVGIVIGTCGINVAHELGHRKEKYEQRLAKILLLPALYMHFFIEHNRGHHRFVATEKDPATAQKGEWLFSFWLKSIVGSFRSAWRLEAERLNKRKLSFWNYQNQMLQFLLLQAAYLTIVYFISSWTGLVVALLSGLVGVLLLETINYLEHYGLQRKRLDSGRYERVRPCHSWNANYQFGRIVLYELTRHSDHHYLASKKYQVLDNHADAPVLPFGYPAMVLLALVPPVWFMIMDKRIPAQPSAVLAP